MDALPRCRIPLLQIYRCASKHPFLVFANPGAELLQNSANSLKITHLQIYLSQKPDIYSPCMTIDRQKGIVLGNQSLGDVLHQLEWGIHPTLQLDRKPNITERHIPRQRLLMIVQHFSPQNLRYTSSPSRCERGYVCLISLLAPTDILDKVKTIRYAEILTVIQRAPTNSNW